MQGGFRSFPAAAAEVNRPVARGRESPVHARAVMGAIFSPSGRRAMNLSRSSIGLHSFQGI
jgi:hypothetical protein